MIGSLYETENGRVATGRATGEQARGKAPERVVHLIGNRYHVINGCKGTCTSVSKDGLEKVTRSLFAWFHYFLFFSRYCHMPHQSLRWKRAETLLVVSRWSHDIRVGENKPLAIMVPPDALCQ